MHTFCQCIQLYSGVFPFWVIFFQQSQSKPYVNFQHTEWIECVVALQRPGELGHSSASISMCASKPMELSTAASVALPHITLASSMPLPSFRFSVCRVKAFLWLRIVFRKFSLHNKIILFGCCVIPSSLRFAVVDVVVAVLSLSRPLLLQSCLTKQKT